MVVLTALWPLTNVGAQDLPADVDPLFKVSSINPLMSIGRSSALVRLDHLEFEVKNRKKAVQRVHKAITIFNDKGVDEGIFGFAYDKLRKPGKISAHIRDANGKVIKKLKKGDIQDLSAISGYSLYDDNRIKAARMVHATFPYTVEYWYEIEFDGYISWPGWEPELNDYPVEKAVFEVVLPDDMDLRYRVRDNAMEPNVSAKSKKKRYVWEASGLNLIEDNFLAAVGLNILPAQSDIEVKIAPEEFQIGGVSGDMRSWEAFGQFYYDLNVGRDNLPEAQKAKVQSLTAGVNSVEEKVKRIYSHFQSTTRYVSVQLGIGGWRAFDAEYVAERGYGDCKALSNYLMSLLHAAGIDAKPVLINSGDRSAVDPDFPSNQFNHVIVMVPTPADTLWLEATSQLYPMGRIGNSNEDRYALAVTENGGELVRTPASESHENTTLAEAEIKLNESGNASGSYQVTYTGNNQNRVLNTLAGESPRYKETWFKESLDIPSFELKSVDFSQVAPGQEPVRITANLELPKLASKTGSRIFLKPGLENRSSYVPPEENNQTRPVELAYVSVTEQRLVYTLPANYKVEAMPENVAIEAPFAEFRLDYTVEGNQLVYHRTFNIKKRTIEAADYNKFREFLIDVRKADKGQIVLVK